MLIEQQDKFSEEFKQIFEFIAKDKLSAAKKFKSDLITQIKEIPNFPYKYRKSIYANDEKLRDMTFRGYVVVYRIGKFQIELVTIFNQNLPTFIE